MSQSYKELTVWKKSVKLSLLIYEITESFPKSEIFGLTSQMRRSAISIPANIAEGSRRNGEKELKHFLSIAFGSGAELETYFYIIKQLPFRRNIDFSKVELLLMRL